MSDYQSYFAQAQLLLTNPANISVCYKACLMTGRALLSTFPKYREAKIMRFNNLIALYNIIRKVVDVTIPMEDIKWLYVQTRHYKYPSSGQYVDTQYNLQRAISIADNLFLLITGYLQRFFNDEHLLGD